MHISSQLFQINKKMILAKYKLGEQLTTYQRHFVRSFYSLGKGRQCKNPTWDGNLCRAHTAMPRLTRPVSTRQNLDSSYPDNELVYRRTSCQLQHGSRVVTKTNDVCVRNQFFVCMQATQHGEGFEFIGQSLPLFRMNHVHIGTGQGQAPALHPSFVRTGSVLGDPHALATSACAEPCARIHQPGCQEGASRVGQFLLEQYCGDKIANQSLPRRTSLGQSCPSPAAVTRHVLGMVLT